jgi:beta-glucosidase
VVTVAFRKRWRIYAAALVVLAVVAAWLVVRPAAPPPPSLVGAIYLDPSYPAQERAADLVSRMTLQEKASQLVSSQAPAIPRLKVRAYGWWNEAVHGVARQQTVDGDVPPELVNTTSYPVSLSLGASWDPALMYRVASAISDEAREVAPDNAIDLNFYSPTVNLARDPRWGRNDETYSEDPYLTAAIASQYVDGMEGKDPTGKLLPDGGGYLKTTTTIKHYAANNSEFNRRTGSSDMDERTLREYYTAQFRSIVRQSQPASIMTAYNEVNGVPASANVHLMQTLGRQTFGFQGFYTSDCDSVYEIEAGHQWSPPGHDGPLDSVQRSAYANAAGEDLNCQLGYHDDANFANSLPDAVSQHVQTELDRYSESDLDASLVRLFTARIRLGEFDDPARVPWIARARAAVAAGSWQNSDANEAVTQTPARLDLARTAAAQSTVLLKNDGGLLPLRVPASGRYRVAVVGYAAKPDALYLGGYSSVQDDAGVAHEVNDFSGLRAAITAADPSATVDYLAGVPTIDQGQVDQAAVAAAANYDVVIVCAGTDGFTAGEDTDRSDLSLPGDQASLIEQIAARNPHTVVYLQTGGQVDVSGFASKVPALLWSSYNGQRQGEALADVLLGTVNPSGHTPFTWYADASQLPPIGDYAIRPTAGTRGRTYMYFTGGVQFPFGYGLSYTTFGYSPLHISSTKLDANATVTVSVDVTNTGKVAGSQVIQLYATTPDAPADRQRPARRLVGLQKVTLDPGKSAQVRLSVAVPDLAFYDQAAGKFTVDTGRYGLEVGDFSGGVRAGATVTVSGALDPVPVTVSASPHQPADAAAGVADRVIYPIGATIDPQLTVAMNDDTLLGSVGLGGGRPLPSGMTVALSSDRPAVVAVDGGAARTVATGVATLTATVSYHGINVSTEFVVVVR